VTRARITVVGSIALTRLLDRWRSEMFGRRSAGLAASRMDAQPSLPTAADVDAVLS
jgi:hypothetical protein